MVEKFDDWIVDGDGEAELLVRWKHHSEDERTWEPLQQLWEDVPHMVAKYVTEVEVPQLTHALAEAKAASTAGTREAKDRAEPQPSAEEQDTASPQEKQNKARDARAAARAGRH